MSTRRALLRHLWAMVQTRAEAGALVVRLQRDALARGLAWYAVAVVAGLSFVTALLLLVALGTPPEYRVAALALLALVLAAAALGCVAGARRQLSRDTALIADFTSGLKLDLAMVNLALKDPDDQDAEALEKREQAKTAVREAAAERAAGLGTAGAGDAPAADDPATDTASAAMRAAAPTATELDLPTPTVAPPEAMTAPRDEEHRRHGSP